MFRQMGHGAAGGVDGDQSSVTARLAHIQAAGERLAHAARKDAMSLEARGLVVAVIAVVELV